MMSAWRGQLSVRRNSRIESIQAINIHLLMDGF